MMDGSLVIAGTNNDFASNVRIDFFGNKIKETTQFNNVFSTDMTLNQNNELLQTCIYSSSSTDQKNYSGFRDDNYFFETNIGINTSKVVVFSDTNVLYSYFDGNGIKLRYSSFYLPDSLWEIDLGIPGPNYKVPNAIQPFNNNKAILAGSIGPASSRNNWIAKVDGVGEEWIPNPCTFSPPQAGFDFTYNYPLLTLHDTSFSGLKYLDTIYTWQWTTSNGMSGTDDSLLVFFDTASSKTLDVQLIVSNWYECTDTLNVTLDFTPSGISVEKELEYLIYPNPVSDVLHIELGEGIDGKVLFEIFDLNGTKMKSETFNGRHLRSKVHGLSSGMYIYTISSDSQVRRGKLVKE
jgi:hypothetical protein